MHSSVGTWPNHVLRHKGWGYLLASQSKSWLIFRWLFELTNSTSVRQPLGPSPRFRRIFLRTSHTCSRIVFFLLFLFGSIGTATSAGAPSKPQGERMRQSHGALPSHELRSPGPAATLIRTKQDRVSTSSCATVTTYFFCAVSTDCLADDAQPRASRRSRRHALPST